MIFEKIRDIHYRIPLSLSEPNHCCSGKATLLKEALEKIGWKVRYRVCEFKWFDLVLPEIVKSVPHDAVSPHVYLEARKDGEWFNVDPSWDSALKHILPVAEWDGKSSTTIAVKPTKLYSHEQSQREMDNSDVSAFEADLKKNGAFYKMFNKYLEDQRLKLEK